MKTTYSGYIIKCNKCGYETSVWENKDNYLSYKEQEEIQLDIVTYPRHMKHTIKTVSKLKNSTRVKLNLFVWKGKRLQYGPKETPFS